MGAQFFLDVDSVQREWNKFKIGLAFRVPGYQNTESNTLLSKTLKDELLQKSIPELAKLFRVVLSLPASTAICERGFSAQNVIKTIRKNSLNDESLETLLRIATNGSPPHEMDHRMVVKAWFAANHKRTDEKKPKTSANTLDDAEGEELTKQLMVVPVNMEAKRKLLFGE